MWPRIWVTTWRERESSGKEIYGMKKKKNVAKVNFLPHLAPDWIYDSPAPNKRYSLTSVSRLLNTRKDTLEKNYLYTILCANVRRSTASGCRGTPYFRRYHRELVLKPAISLKKSWGDYRRTTHSYSLFPAFLSLFVHSSLGKIYWHITYCGAVVVHPPRRYY